MFTVDKWVMPNDAFDLNALTPFFSIPVLGSHVLFVLGRLEL
jgi:hypothetical protein